MEIHFQTTDHVVAVGKVAEQHIGTRTNNKRDIGTFKFGQNQSSRVLWQSVDDLEQRASRSNVCMVIEGIYMC